MAARSPVFELNVRLVPVLTGKLPVAPVANNTLHVVSSDSSASVRKPYRRRGPALENADYMVSLRRDAEEEVLRSRMANLKRNSVEVPSALDQYKKLN